MGLKGRSHPTSPLCPSSYLAHGCDRGTMLNIKLEAAYTNPKLSRPRPLRQREINFYTVDIYVRSLLQAAKPLSKQSALYNNEKGTELWQ